MPRAAYNATGAVYSNTGDPGVGDYRFSASCRLVASTRWSTQRPPDLFVDAYVNWNGPSVIPGDSSEGDFVIDVDLHTADFWEIPEGSGDYWIVIHTAIIIPQPGRGSPYRRAWLRRWA